jgi:acyl carrier protein
MKDDVISEKVNNALIEEFELDPALIRPEASLGDDLGLDSLDAVDMVIVLEQTFGIKIGKDEAIQQIRTLGDVYAYIIEKRNALEDKSLRS